MRPVRIIPARGSTTLLAVTDRDLYRFDELKGALTTADGEIAIAPRRP